MAPRLPVQRERGRRRRAWPLLALGTTTLTLVAVQWVGWLGAEASLEAGGRAVLFAGALLAILVVHEGGHLLAARRHGVAMHWPIFLPSPVFVGTLGAIIRLREHPRTREALVTIGAAGPLAGGVMLVALTGLWVAMGPAEPAGEGLRFHAPPIMDLAHRLGTGRACAGVDPADPVGFAVWWGCLVTAFNLLPFGQLDGGHIIGGLAPRWARRLGIVTTAALLLLGFWWIGWALWIGALHLLGARQPLPLRQLEPPPGPRARALAVAAGILLVLTLTPRPVGGLSRVVASWMLGG